MFKHAIVRTPCKSMTEGLTSANLGKPDYYTALKQHEKYIAALKECGVEVTILDSDDRFPDSTFVEDVALMTPHCAVITNPCAPSRRDETKEIIDTVKIFYDDVEFIESPGTLEAGDVMMVGSHYYIGLSERTNNKGADQLIAILEKYGMSGSVVKFEKVLHLKTGLAYLENNNLLAAGEFIDQAEFQKYNIIKIDDEESYAANSIWVNGKVLVPKGFPKAKAAIESAGYNIIEVDVSEFRKLDGGLSCLSLRF